MDTEKGTDYSERDRSLCIEVREAVLAYTTARDLIVTNIRFLANHEPLREAVWKVTTEAAAAIIRLASQWDKYMSQRPKTPIVEPSTLLTWSATLCPYLAFVLAKHPELREHKTGQKIRSLSYTNYAKLRKLPKAAPGEKRLAIAEWAKAPTALEDPHAKKANVAGETAKLLQ